MISFRFHLVSVVAVFLALGLGVLTGTTVINRSIVAQLERQTSQLADSSATLRSRVDALDAEVSVWGRFGTAVMPHVVGGRLSGQSVVLVTQEGTSGAAINGVRRALEDSGAEFAAVLAVSERIALPTPDDQSDLATILGLPADTDPAELARRAAAALAARLTFGNAGGTGERDLIRRLLAEGFLLDRGPSLDEAAFEQVGGRDQPVVVVAGGEAEPAAEPEAFLVPLVQTLTANRDWVAAAEARATTYPFVELLRADGRLAGEMVTQDNVDQVPGGIGIVLAMEELIRDGRGGHYGEKPGAARLIPAPS